MDAMTAKDFLTLGKRDYENGAVTDAIYAALKEREKLIEGLPEITEDWVEEKVRELYEKVSELNPSLPTYSFLNLARDFLCSFIDELALKIKQANRIA